MIRGILIPLLFIATPVKAHMGHSFPTGEWIQKIREYESKRKRISIDEMLNNTLMEYENGSDGSTESEELLQLSSNED
jgi:hypothetical protein